MWIGWAKKELSKAFHKLLDWLELWIQIVMFQVQELYLVILLSPVFINNRGWQGIFKISLRRPLILLSVLSWPLSWFFWGVPHGGSLSKNPLLSSSISGYVYWIKSFSVHGRAQLDSVLSLSLLYHSMKEKWIYMATHKERITSQMWS